MKVCTNCTGKGFKCKYYRAGYCAREFPTFPQEASFVRLENGIVTKDEYNAMIDNLDLLDMAREKRVFMAGDGVFATDKESATVVAHILGIK